MRVVSEGGMPKKVLFTMVVLAGLIGAPRMAVAGCMSDLGDCYVRAANVDGFWYRWAAGIDCELTYVDCTRTLLVGD
jgi:hypothetical protein